MAILVSHEIFSAICEELASATKSVQIMTAYGKTNAISMIINKVSSAVDNKRIMFRFRLDDLLKGSTDFAVIDCCRNQGWKVYIRFDLHAKTYIVDNKRGIIGSANATSSGLALNNRPNYEIATLADIEKSDISKIDALFEDAILVDDDLWIELQSEFADVKKMGNEQTSGCDWSQQILSKFNPHINTLFSFELPEHPSYKQGDYLHFLDMEYVDDMSVKSAFRWSKPYLWLLELLRNNGGTMYYGAVSAALHNALVSDPKPYRKDVKELLSNLLSLIDSFEMKEIVIDRPNHSQRIRLK